ncbi:MAG TPA: UDP-2,3-diacylglucosamine diphosphatase [Ramlibacter sp.]|jgi:UDP-2,3-diacylglucosamine hydrolase|nr:UDP-2,3-diacylglucosamine diphosphatase [Ramlibacter sp.]
MALPPAPQAQELQAAPHWRTVECISDLHLQASVATTWQAWKRYLAETQADAIFLLGDLFEAWVGDDVAEVSGFEQDCAGILRDAAQERPLFFLAGNRDFLVGPGLAASVGLTILQDPTVFGFGPQRWLLSHGDALCVGDTEYLAFRAQVRDPEWQRAFLAQPLQRRQAIARAMRAESEEMKRSGREYADVDTAAALSWLDAADATVLVHGHTHRPGEYALGAKHLRIVLTDWDADAVPPRMETLRLHVDGHAERVPLA